MMDEAASLFVFARRRPETYRAEMQLLGTEAALSHACKDDLHSLAPGRFMKA